MKKIALLIILTYILLFTSQSLAESGNPLFWSKAVAMLDINNNTIANLAATEKTARDDYETAYEATAGINTTSATVSIMGEEMSFRYDPYISMLQTQRKELYPEQLKLVWEMDRDGRTVTHNALIVGLRGLYLGLYSADSDYKLKQTKLDLVQTINKQDKIKLQNGMISDIDKAESDYNLIKAQKDAEAAKRNYENMLRSFNSFIGVSLDTKYDEVLFEEQYTANVLQPLDFYVNKGVSGRLDVTGAEKQLALMEKQKAIIDDKKLSLNTVSVRKDYDNLLVQIESQKLKLEKAKLDVEKGIKDAYVEVTTAGKSVANMKKQLDLQLNNLENTKKKFQAGFISKTVLDQVQIGADQLQNGYNATLFDYNTKLMKLENAAGLGPAYQEGAK